MNIRLADSHAHLDLEELLPDQSEVVGRAREAGVALIVNVATGLKDAPRVIETTGKYPGIWAAVGVHPHGAKNITEPDLETLAEMAVHPRVIAIGEIGLDFYRRRSPAETQEHWFRRQLELAESLKKPVIIHTREATAATLTILREYRGRVRGVMHCFAGNLTEARDFLDLGMFLSFSGTLTYPKAGILREVAKEAPLDRLLVETDCPYLPPQPWRGKRNEPAYVVATARQLAEVRGLSLEETAKATWENTLRVFRLQEEEVFKK
ncbi:MAG: TatD family hydrolase [Deltaproteobacteria bacterium]|nr:TatD family hydrolase [Deltaproteobacteria bacterium]